MRALVFGVPSDLSVATSAPATTGNMLLDNLAVTPMA
jgi:hypothetical protein